MRVLITGGTGFLGRGLVADLLTNEMVERVCVLSRDEHKVHALAEQYRTARALRCFVGDVRDADRLRHACRGVDAVIHAAALKRVDAVTNEPSELLKTNVEGTRHVLDAACDAGVRKLVLVSSDKAVMPTNAYGASKQQAEWLTIGFNTYSVPRGMRCAVVRYGNVLGSTGSVVPVWRAQLGRGEPIHVTDARMTRFSLTCAEAVRFVLTSLQRMQGGEIFVPILPSYRLVDLAQALAPDLPYRAIGLRPGGEKLHERLLSDEEPSRTVLQAGRYVVMPAHRSWSADPYEGTAIDPHWRYESCAVTHLTVSELTAMLAHMPNVGS